MFLAWSGRGGSPLIGSPVCYGILWQCGRRRSVSADAAAVLAVREAVGPAVRLRADANRRWGLAEAVQFAQEAAGAGLDFIEVRAAFLSLSGGCHIRGFQESSLEHLCCSPNLRSLNGDGVKLWGSVAEQLGDCSSAKPAFHGTPCAMPAEVCVPF